MVSIPNTVTKIGYGAFRWTSLKSIVIPNSVIEIGEWCFWHCVSLASAALPNQIRVIPGCCFSECTTLRDVIIPESVVEIGERGFAGTAINSANLSSNCKSLGDTAFGYCPNLKKVTIENVSQITQNQFCGSTNIEELVLGEGVRDIGVEAFFYNGSPAEGLLHLRSLTLGNNITNIGAKAFYYAGRALNTPPMNVVIPPSVETIGSGAFYGCSSLAEVDIFYGVKTIGSSAFSCCSSLAEVVIPRNVETIGSHAFSRCSPLTKVTLEVGLKTLGENMFYCSDIKEIFVPKSIAQIGLGAFYSCKNLKEITLEDGLPLLGVSMFAGCTSLQKVSIPASVRQLGASSFYVCTGLTTVNLSEGLDSIGQSAFQGCVGLRAMSFPESLNTIGNTAFSGCTSLSTISFPSGVSEVGIGAFSGCSVKSMLFNNANGEFLDQFAKGSLRTLFLGKCADGITGGLLSDCSSLETIMTAAANPNYSVDDCGVLFDKGKTKLIKYPCAASHQSYTAPETVKSVDDGAFAFASALQDIDFPASLTTVGESAFDWCLGLGYVCFPATLRTIGAGAFTTCPSLEDLYFEGNAPTIGDNQFWYSSPVFHVQENTTGWDAVAERFDVEVAIGEGSGGEDSPALTMDWLAQYPTLWSAAGGDLATAAKMTAANGLTLNECYIAGLDPTDPDSKFEARIDIVDGQPIVTWKPQLDKADAALRTYTTYGCSEIGGAWIDIDTTTTETKATLKFFKVSVDMK